MNEYLAIESGGYLCMNSHSPLVVARLNSSKKSQVGIHLDWTYELDTALYKHITVTFYNRKWYDNITPRLQL